MVSGPKDECEKLKPAFEAIGSMWLHSSDGIFVEHRATELCLAALHQLSAILPTNDRGPRFFQILLARRLAHALPSGRSTFYVLRSTFSHTGGRR